MFVRILPLGLVVLAVACVLIAALTPVSRQKGRIRLHIDGRELYGFPALQTLTSVTSEQFTDNDFSGTRVG